MLRALAVVVALMAGLAAAQPPERWLDSRNGHYSVFSQPGFERDVAFTRRWLDAAEQLMKSKYGVDEYST